MKAFTNIEELKEQWLKQTKDTLKKPLSYKEVEAITRKKSMHELSRLKRKFIIESAVSIPILIALIILVNLWALPSEALMFNILTSIVLIIFSVLFLRILSIWKNNTESIADYLNRAVPLIQRLNQAAQTITMFIMPLSFVCGFIIGIMHDNKQSNLSDIFTPSAISIGVVAMLCTCIAGYFGMKYYNKAVYKKHINRLEELRQDINRAEAEDKHTTA